MSRASAARFGVSSGLFPRPRGLARSLARQPFINTSRNFGTWSDSTHSSQTSLLLPRLESIPSLLLQAPHEKSSSGPIHNTSLQQIPPELRKLFGTLHAKFRTDQQFQNSVKAFIMEVTEPQEPDGYTPGDYKPQKLEGLTLAEVTTAFRKLENTLSETRAKLRSEKTCLLYYKKIAKGVPRAPKVGEPETRMPHRISVICQKLTRKGDMCGKANPPYEKKIYWVPKTACTRCGGPLPAVVQDSSGERPWTPSIEQSQTDGEEALGAAEHSTAGYQIPGFSPTAPLRSNYGQNYHHAVTPQRQYSPTSEQGYGSTFQHECTPPSNAYPGMNPFAQQQYQIGPVAHSMSAMQSGLQNSFQSGAAHDSTAFDEDPFLSVMQPTNRQDSNMFLQDRLTPSMQQVAQQDSSTSIDDPLAVFMPPSLMQLSTKSYESGFPQHSQPYSAQPMTQQGAQHLVQRYWMEPTVQPMVQHDTQLTVQRHSIEPTFSPMTIIQARYSSQPPSAHSQQHSSQGSTQPGNSFSMQQYQSQPDFTSFSDHQGDSSMHLTQHSLHSHSVASPMVSNQFSTVPLAQQDREFSPPSHLTQTGNLPNPFENLPLSSTDVCSSSIQYSPRPRTSPAASYPNPTAPLDQASTELPVVSTDNLRIGQGPTFEMQAISDRHDKRRMPRVDCQPDYLITPTKRSRMTQPLNRSFESPGVSGDSIMRLRYAASSGDVRVIPESLRNSQQDLNRSDRSNGGGDLEMPASHASTFSSIPSKETIGSAVSTSNLTTSETFPVMLPLSTNGDSRNTIGAVNSRSRLATLHLPNTEDSGNASIVVSRESKESTPAKQGQKKQKELPKVIAPTRRVSQSGKDPKPLTEEEKIKILKAQNETTSAFLGGHRKSWQNSSQAPSQALQHGAMRVPMQATLQGCPQNDQYAGVVRTIAKAPIIVISDDSDSSDDSLFNDNGEIDDDEELSKEVKKDPPAEKESAVENDMDAMFEEEFRLEFENLENVREDEQGGSPLAADEQQELAHYRANEQLISVEQDVDNNMVAGIEGEILAEVVGINEANEQETQLDDHEKRGFSDVEYLNEKTAEESEDSEEE